MTDEAEYVGLEPCEIDDGQLDNLRPELVFILGVEWEIIRGQTLFNEDIERPVHTDNYRRVDHMLARNGYYRRWQHGDDWSFVRASTHGLPEEQSA